MQLMAIKEPCWGDTCPFWRDFNCYLLAFLKLFIYFFSVANCALILFDSLGRCWISAVSTVFKQNHRCCKPLLEEWCVMKSLSSPSARVSVAPGGVWVAQPFQPACPNAIFVPWGRIVRACNLQEQLGVMLSEECHWRKWASMNEGETPALPLLPKETLSRVMPSEARLTLTLRVAGASPNKLVQQYSE